MNSRRFLAYFIALATPGMAGGLNVIHFGPSQVINLEVKAGKVAHKFTLNKEESSGPFMLPEKKATLRTVGDKIKAITIKPQAAGRLAVLHPTADSYRWDLFPSKPAEGKTVLRLINLSKEATSVTIGGKKTEIAGSADQVIENVTRTPIRLTFSNGEKAKPFDQEEPSAVVGFLLFEQDTWHVVYVEDR